MRAMHTLIIAGLTCFVLLTGCAKAPMAVPERDISAKQFTPVPGKAVVYVYRNEHFGAAIKVPIVINNQTVGSTVAMSYFRIMLDPGPCVVECKAERDGKATFQVEAGKIYFFRQEMKMGFLAGACMMHLIPEVEGRQAIAECQLLESPETLPK